MNNIEPNQEKKDTTTSLNSLDENVGNQEPPKETPLPLEAQEKVSAYSAPPQANQPNLYTPLTPPNNGANQNMVPPMPNQPPFSPQGNQAYFGYPPAYPPHSPQPYNPNQGNPVPFPTQHQVPPPYPPNYGQPPQPYAPPYETYGSAPPVYPPNYNQGNQPRPTQNIPPYQPRPPQAPISPPHGNQVPFSGQGAPQPLYNNPAHVAKKSSDFEQALGGKITSIVGIFFILLAVVFGLYYTYTFLKSDIIKTVIAYAVGFVFLLVGELFGRKSKGGRGYFSIGLCAGGISILFATTAISYFELNVFSDIGAIVACGIAFLIAIFLALRNDSQLIGVFAIIGGYIPIFALDTHLSSVVVSVVYFSIINLLVLFFAQKKNWTVIKYFALIFSIFICNYIFNETGNYPVLLVGGFAIFTSLLFLAITLIKPLRLGEKLSINERILLGINAVFFALTINDIVVDVSYSYDWVTPLFFALLYFALFFLFKISVKQDKPTHSMLLTLATIFLFIGSFLKFQPITCITIVVVEGILLLIFSIITNDKSIKTIGGTFTAIAVSMFYILSSERFTLGLAMFSESWLKYLDLEYMINFGVITLGLLAVILVLKFRNRENKSFFAQPKSTPLEAFKGLTFINSWLFLVMLVQFTLKGLPASLALFWPVFLACFVTMVLLLLVFKMGVVNSILMRLSVIVPAFYAAYSLIYKINFSRIVKDYSQYSSLKVSVIAAVIVINIFAVFTLYSLLKTLIKSPTNQLQLIPLIVSLTSLVLAYSVCRHHLLGQASVVLSILVLVWALAMVIYGFIRNIKTVRLTGLALSAAAVFKIFVLDLFFVHGWQRALSYAIIGIIFIGISFAYQHFSNKFLPKKTAATKTVGATTPSQQNISVANAPMNQIPFDQSPNRLIVKPEPTTSEFVDTLSDGDLLSYDQMPELKKEDNEIIKAIEENLSYDSQETEATLTEEITKED